MVQDISRSPADPASDGRRVRGVLQPSRPFTKAGRQPVILGVTTRYGIALLAVTHGELVGDMEPCFSSRR